MNFETAQTTYGPSDRLSGILLHPTSLPSPYGIGDLGDGAYEFIDFLNKAGQHLWQVLPLNPTGFGDSPYQSFSAFAGQPLLISPDDLQKLDLISAEDLKDLPDTDSETVDYGTVIPWKNELLRKAYEKFCHTADKMLLEEYDSFCRENEFWLSDYTLYMACKAANDGRSWLDWKAPYRNPSPAEKTELMLSLKHEIHYYKFVQFIFFRQWYALKAYANDKDIKIIGDIPIFVSLDSADVWSHQELFLLDEEGYPTVVAGVPPDYFSATGQLWGNPLYDWKVHKKTGYAWWIARIRNQLDLVDYLRIDHFRGFEAFWAVPANAESAALGTWKRGPKEDLFLAIQKALGDHLPIIAEDLGIITPEVEKLRDTFGFPGMKVLQFAFESEEESAYLPHQFTTTNCVCYTGTHDNDTSMGWYINASPKAQDKVRRYMNTDGNSVHFDFIRTCLGSIAAYAIFPMQDVLGVNSDGRMNVPGKAAGNWSWRFCREALSDSLAEYLKSLSHLYGRY